MKGVVICAIVSVSALGWCALSTPPQAPNGSGASTTPVVLEFARFIEKSPEIARLPSSMPANAIAEQKSGLSTSASPPPLNESQKQFVGALFEEFKRPGRGNDPAWRRNVDDLMEIAAQTLDPEALDLTRTEIMAIASDQSIDENTREAVRKWMVKYQSIEPRETKRGLVSLNMLDR